jgi:4-hydroxy-tetrahydrodipicolinate reductase
VKLALLGYGRMGRMVEEVARARGHEITAILDEHSNPGGNGITDEALAGAKMAIDFSVTAAVPANALRAAERGVSLVIGTTGWDAERESVERAVRTAGTGLLTAANFSVGMLLFSRIVQAAARMVNRLDEYDVHLWEAHHRHKADHPGGTARALADLLVEAIDRKDAWTVDLGRGSPIDPRTLHVSVARVGELAGVHGVGIDGPDDRIELRHEARSRRGFALGAVVAAEWLAGRSGVFTLDDMADDLLGGEA